MSNDLNSSVSKNFGLWHLLEIAFLALMLYLPFQLALNIGADIDLASGRLFIPGLFLFWLAGALFFKKKIFVASFQGFGLIAFLVICGLSLFVAQEFGWGLRKLVFLLSVFPVFYVSASLTAKKGMFERIIKYLIVSAFLVSLAGFVQFLAQFLFSLQTVMDFYIKKIGPFFWGRAFSAMVSEYPSWLVNISGKTVMRAFGLFPDPHMLAFFIGLALPIVFSLFLFGNKNKNFWFFISGFLFLVLLLTFSRGGYMGIFFAIIAVMLLGWKFLTQKNRFILSVGLALVLLLVFVFAQPIVGRFTSTFSLSDGSSAERLAIWQDAWNVFLSHPVIGVGLGNYPKEANPLAIYRSPITSHNLYLDILSETGIFGFMIWAGLFLGSAWQLFVGIKKRDFDDLIAIRIGLLGSLVYFSAHAFFETAMFSPAVLASLLIIFSLISVVNSPSLSYGNNN